MVRVRIMPYRGSDYPAVRAALREAGLFSRVWDARDVLRRKIRQRPGSILVAERDGTVLGCVYLIEDAWCSFLFRLAVRKAERRKGVGGLLLARAEARLRRKGLRGVAIHVREDEWEQLAGFYRKRGYRKWKYRVYSLEKRLQAV